MCLIIYKSTTGTITKERLEQAHKANCDGWGLMWSNGLKLLSMKNTTPFEDFWDAYTYLEGKRNLVIHFRTASSGKIDLKHCHPYRINENLYFMQNGNFFQYSNYFPGIDPTDGKTDVGRFNEQVLKKLSFGNSIIDLADSLVFTGQYGAINNYCKSNFSKMIFMNSLGETTIFNEEAGEWKDGCWYSNGGIDDYIGYGYSGAYTYHQNDIRHKGGLISVQMFSDKEKENWDQCIMCKGWFHYDIIKDRICNDCRIWGDLLYYTKEN